MRIMVQITNPIASLARDLFGFSAFKTTSAGLVGLFLGGFAAAQACSSLARVSRYWSMLIFSSARRRSSSFF